MYFVVLSSSRGTTLQSVIDSLNNGWLTATCLGLVSDKDNRECLEKATKANLPTGIAGYIKGEEREYFDKRVHECIQKLCNDYGVEQDNVVIAEMGWMWIHSPWFIERYAGRILNVHPALLPKYGGKGMYGMHVHEAVLTNNEAESGMTIHVIDEGVDTGPVLLQKRCVIEPNDTAEDVQKKVQNLEKEWYPKALQMIEDGEIEL